MPNVNPIEAKTLLKQGLAFERDMRLEDSERVLLEASRLAPSIGYLTALARVHCKLKHFAEAVRAFEKIVTLDPEQPSAYVMLAKLKSIVGDDKGSIATLIEARERFPFDIVIARACAGTDAEADTRSINAMKSALHLFAGDSSKTSPILRFLTEQQAIANRQAAGLPVNAGRSWTDIALWADQEGMSALAASLDRELAMPVSRAEAVAERAIAAMNLMDWKAAENWFSLARQKETGTLSDVISLDVALYRELDGMTEDAIVSPLPTIVDVVPRSTNASRSIFLASDPRYFEMFTLPLLESLNGWPLEAQVHIHIMDGEPDDWRRLTKELSRFSHINPSMTAEASEAKQRYGIDARNYYHAIRFVRFYQFLVRNKLPSWVFDVDGIVEANPDRVLKLLDNHELAMQTNPIGWWPSDKISAFAVGVAPTPTGLAYIRIVAAYISYWYIRRGLRWGIDQLALFGAHFYLESIGNSPKMSFLSRDLINNSRHEPCVLRFVTGERKFVQPVGPA